MFGLGEGVAADHKGRLAGTALCWRFGADWATAGLIGVSDALQGQGIGRRLMNALLDRLSGRSIVLHSTRAGLKLYVALGFEPVETVVQYQGSVAARPRALAQRRAPPAGRPCRSVLSRGSGSHVDGPKRSDRRVGRAARRVVLDRSGEPIGFGLVRRFGHGQVIGPLVAPDIAGARAMAAHLLGQRTCQFMRMDVP